VERERYRWRLVDAAGSTWDSPWSRPLQLAAAEVRPLHITEVTP
jgi:hypothetical protein